MNTDANCICITQSQIIFCAKGLKPLYIGRNHYKTIQKAIKISNKMHKTNDNKIREVKIE